MFRAVTHLHSVPGSIHWAGASSPRACDMACGGPWKPRSGGGIMWADVCFLGEQLYNFPQILKWTHDPKVLKDHDWLWEALCFCWLLLFPLEAWAGLWQWTCRPWNSGRVPIWFPCQLPPTAGFGLLPFSTVCCPSAGPKLCRTGLAPWHRRCPCPVYFPNNYSPVWSILEPLFWT